MGWVETMGKENEWNNVKDVLSCLQQMILIRYYTQRQRNSHGFGLGQLGYSSREEKTWVILIQF